MRSILFAAMAIFGLSACLGPAEGQGIVSTPRPFLPQDPAVTRFGDAEMLGILKLEAPGQRWFGGLSGMSLDGDTVTTINDSGHWWRFRLVSDPSGRPLRAEALEGGPLGGLDGSKEDGDGEELAALPDGWLVSFERRHRILRYPRDLSARPERLSAPPGLKDLPDNGGIEAMARLADGRLLLISEEGGADGLSPAWIGRPGQWQELSYRREGLFAPTAATLLDNGDVLVLERRFTWVGGVSARVVRLGRAQLVPGAMLEGRELFRIEPPHTIDNMEAIAARRRPDGRLLVHLLSDDNFSAMQASLLMVVLLPPDE